MLYFMSSDALIWTALAVLLLLCGAAGIVATIPGPDRRAGKGAQHRAPGLPRVTPSGTYPRRRAVSPYAITRAELEDFQERRSFAESLGMDGGPR